MSMLISVLIIYLFGYIISERDEDAEWKSNDYQNRRLSAAKSFGYDVTSVIVREKYHEKYGYIYDKEMYGKPFDITFREAKIKKDNGSWWCFDIQEWVKKDEHLIWDRKKAKFTGKIKNN